MNLLLNFRSFVVCMGIDARIITGAVEKHYEGLPGCAGASGYEYLDKIVQIPFRIPEPGRADILTFIAGQLGDPVKPEPDRKPGTAPGDEPPAPGDTAPTATTGSPDEAPPDSAHATRADDTVRQRAGRLRAGLLRPRPNPRRPAAARRARAVPPRPADVAFTYAELERLRALR